jgi:hypothetical protein
MATTDKICAHCYSRAALSTYRRNAAVAYDRNAWLADRPILPHEIPTIVGRLFRLHSHGELHNTQHLSNLATIASANPLTIFALWTKRRGIVNAFHAAGNVLPSNMVLIYSNPIIDKPMTQPPKYFNKVFSVVSSADVAPINCGARKCATCQLCYSKSTTPTIIEKLK